MTVCISSVENKEDILKKVSNQTLLVTIDFHCRTKEYRHISQNIDFYIPQMIKVIQIWDNM